MSEKVVLRAIAIEKSFPGVKALEDISFDLREGEIHALVGENGAGKSTLMNILSGVYDYDSGSVELYGRAVKFKDTHDALENGISMIHQELALAPSVSVAENIFIGRIKASKGGIINLKAIKEECQQLLDQYDVKDILPGDKVADLSVSQMQVVEIVKAMSRNNRILIMDEPTAALAQDEVEKLLSRISKLRDNGYSIIYISHRLEEIKQIADRITVFRDGKLIKTADNSELSFNDIISLMVGRPVTDAFTRKTKSTPEVVLKVEDLTSSKVHDISFELHKGEVLGVTGLVGAGRSELLETLFGKYSIKTGKILIEGKTAKITEPAIAIKNGIGLVPEGRKIQGLYLNRSVLENISSVVLQQGGMVINKKEEKSGTKEMIGKLNVKTPSLQQQVQYLSGGNQQKTIIARWLLNNPRVLLLDEPTHGVDVGAKREIYQIIDDLTSQGVSIVIVSSELPEVMMISDRVAVMHDYTITHIFEKDEVSQEKIMEYAI